MIPAVEKWREIAQKEINDSGVPLPVEHILAIIQRESGGTVGALNPTGGDSGLMQVNPISLEEYNRNNDKKYPIAQLRQKTESSAAIQIRVGLWILAYYLKMAYRYLKRRLGYVALDDLIKITDTFYASGPKRSKKKLDRILQPTWDNVKENFPNWGRIAPAELIWQRANDAGAQWSLPQIDNWLEGQIVIETKKSINGALIAILLIAIAWTLLGRAK